MYSLHTALCGPRTLVWGICCSLSTSSTPPPFAIPPRFVHSAPLGSFISTFIPYIPTWSCVSAWALGTTSVCLRLFNYANMMISSCVHFPTSSKTLLFLVAKEKSSIYIFKIFKTWLLGTGFGSSIVAVSAPDCWAISSVLSHILFIHPLLLDAGWGVRWRKSIAEGMFQQTSPVFPREGQRAHPGLSGCAVTESVYWCEWQGPYL